MTLSENQIHIWHVNLDAKSSSIAAFQNTLSVDEITRANRIKNPALRLNFINARGALRIILGKYLSKQPNKLSLATSHHGKPFLQNDTLPIEFNVSHCQGLCLIVVTLKRKVGIDVEQVGHLKDWTDIAKYSFSQHEQLELFSYPTCEQEAAFIRGWTRKEAYTKARGEGLLYGFPEFTVSLKALFPKLIHDDKNPHELSNWQFTNINVETPFVATLVTDKQGMQLSEFYF